MFSSVYCKYNLYVYNYSDSYIYIYSTVVLLAPLMLVMVEKAIYEATSVKQSYSECKTLFFCHIY